MAQIEAKQIFIPANVSIHTARLVAYLSMGKPGDVLTDEQLTERCGKNTRVSGDGYSYLLTAIRYVQRHHELAWFRIRGSNAIKGGNADEILEHSESGVSGIRRRSKKIMTQIGIARTGELDDAGMTKANVIAAQVGTMLLMTKRKTCKKLENMEKEQLDPSKLLSAFVV